MRKTGIFGYPLGLSISPHFQNAAFNNLGIEATYTAWPVDHAELPERIQTLKQPDFLGANVTIPYKEAVIPLLDEIDEGALKIGSVNTIVNHCGTLVGHNTDTVGFLRSILEYGNYEPAGQDVLLIGAGGAARAAAYALMEAKVNTLWIANRTYERAKRLADEFFQVGEVKPIGLNDLEFSKAAASVSLIVNSTSLGMKHTSEAQINPLERLNIKSSTLVNDMVYNPLYTPMLTNLENNGIRILNGLPMLVLQGAASFELWTSREAPVDIMFSAAQQALLGQSD